MTIDILDPTETTIKVVDQQEKTTKNGSDPDIVTMSTGIKFCVKSVSRQGLAAISERYSRTKPKIPIVEIEGKGREDENPDDPDYQEAMYAWNMSLSMAVNNYLLLRGADVLEETISDDLVHFNSHEWREEVDIIGGDSSNSRLLYLEWIKSIAAPKNNYIDSDGVENRGDIAKLLYAIGKKSGTAREDVDEAVNNFRR